MLSSHNRAINRCPYAKTVVYDSSHLATSPRRCEAKLRVEVTRLRSDVAMYISVTSHRDLAISIRIFPLHPHNFASQRRNFASQLRGEVARWPLSYTIQNNSCVVMVTHLFPSISQPRREVAKSRGR